jgi:molybdopterin/thiamine biosynthesis adenylyltransferase
MSRVDGQFERIAQAGIRAERLQASSALLIVSDFPISHFRGHPLWPLCRGLWAMGLGRIHVAGALEYLDELESTVADPCLTQVPGIWLDAGCADVIPDIDLVLELSNRSSSRSVSEQVAADRDVPLLSFAWGSCWAGVGPGSTDFDLQPDRRSTAPNPAVSRIVAGLAMHEFLIALAELELGAPLEGPVVYNCADVNRTGTQEHPAWDRPHIEGAVIDVIGAGGIGVHLLESLAPLLDAGCTLRLFDADQVCPENISSQIAYRAEDIGRPKARAITEHLIEAAMTRAKIQPFATRYEDQPPDLPRPAIRVLCVDNYATRFAVNELSLADGVPLAEAGGSPFASQQRSYRPGMTPCLAHHIPDLEGKAARESARQSCSRNPLTLPGTNAIIGGILATEVLHTLTPERYGPPSTGTITYDARFPERFAVVNEQPACCHHLEK